MSGCRFFYSLGLIALVLAPLLMPFREMMEPAAWHWSSDDAQRLWQLSLNTFALTAGTVGAASPIGVGLAVLLFRTSFFGRRLLLFLLAILLFIPLPVLVSAGRAFSARTAFCQRAYGAMQTVARGCRGWRRLSGFTRWPRFRGLRSSLASV